MKKLFLTTFLMSCFFIKAQQTSCNYQKPADFYTATGYSKQARALVPSDACLVFNVKFHYVLGSQGQNQDNINEDRLLKIIQAANLKFNQFKIYFKYRGNDHINDDSFVNVTSIDGTRNKFIQEGLYDYSAINIFFIRGANSGAVAWGDLFISPNLDDASIAGYNVPHEMGHTLGLSHIETAGGYNFLNTNLPECISNATIISDRRICKPSVFGSYSENVTRDTNNPNYNAHNSGDLVIDTHACFDGFTNNYCKDGISSPLLFMEDTRVVDNMGETYKYLTSERRNFMVGRSSFDYTDSFTPGQGIRMRETILSSSYSANFHQKLNLLSDDSADVSVLFEPYESTIVPGEIVSTTDLGNGYAKVCRAWLMQQKFQPGFTYFFPQNSDTDPVNVANTDFPVPPVKYHTFDYPLSIAELSQGGCGGDGISGVVCTRGLSCQDEPFTSGIIISTKDLLSMNVNIEELDAIKVKDPQLYNSLMSEYYYKLKKETESGAKVETVFYKQ